MILVDSDHLSVLLDTRSPLRRPLLDRLKQAGDVALPIIAVEEQLRGWLAQIRRFNDVEQQVQPYTHLASAIQFAQQWQIVSWNHPAAGIFKRLRKSGIRIGTQDLKIGSLALEHDALLLSANLRDFEQIPGLRVADWLR